MLLVFLWAHSICHARESATLSGLDLLPMRLRRSGEGDCHAEVRDTQRNLTPGPADFPLPGERHHPWTPMRHDLSHSKLALVTTAGLHLRSDTPLSAILRGMRHIVSCPPRQRRRRSSRAMSVLVLITRPSTATSTSPCRSSACRSWSGRALLLGAAEHYSFMGAIRNPPCDRGDGS